MIVALIGYKGSGKSAVADAFIDHHFVRRAFADPIKEMLRVGLGLTQAQLYGDEKEVPCEALGGKTPREAFITLGSSWGRDMMFKDIWVQRFLASTPQDQHIICDDLRLPNEASQLLSFGTWFIKVMRPGVGKESAHESEAFADLLPYHKLIVNDGSKEDLGATVTKFLVEHKNVSEPLAYGHWAAPDGSVSTGPMRDRIQELLTHKDVDHAENRSQT